MHQTRMKATLCQVDNMNITSPVFCRCYFGIYLWKWDLFIISTITSYLESSWNYRRHLLNASSCYMWETCRNPHLALPFHQDDVGNDGRLGQSPWRFHLGSTEGTSGFLHNMVVLTSTNKDNCSDCLAKILQMSYRENCMCWGRGMQYLRDIFREMFKGWNPSSLQSKWILPQ